MNSQEYELGWNAYLEPFAAIGRRYGAETRDCTWERTRRETALGDTLQRCIDELSQSQSSHRRLVRRW